MQSLHLINQLLKLLINISLLCMQALMLRHHSLIYNNSLFGHMPNEQLLLCIILLMSVSAVCMQGQAATIQSQITTSRCYRFIEPLRVTRSRYFTNVYLHIVSSTRLLALIKYKIHTLANNSSLVCVIIQLRIRTTHHHNSP